MEETEHMPPHDSLSEKIEMLDHSLSIASKMANAWKALFGAMVVSVLWVARVEYAIADLQEKEEAADENLHSIAEIVAQLKTQSALHQQSLESLRRNTTSQNVDVRVGTMADGKDYKEAAKRRGYYVVDDLVILLNKSERTITDLCLKGVIKDAYQPQGGRGWRIPLDFDFSGILPQTAAVSGNQDTIP